MTMTIIGTLMARQEDIKHDIQTLNSYPNHVKNECTCGYHSPPVGLASNPMSHIEYCAYRTNRLRNAVVKSKMIRLDD